LANDTFDASLNAGNQTLSSQDNLAGGGGVDTLNAIVVNAGTVRPTLTNIANLNFTANTNASTVDLTNSTNYKTLQNTGSSFGLTFDKIADATDTLMVTANSTAAAAFTFTDASLAGASDVVPLVLDGAGGTVTISDAGGSNNIETLAITASNGNSALTSLATGTTGTGVNVTNITVAGSANLDLGGALSASVSNVDASKATGNVTAVLGAAPNATIQGGAGSDTFTVTNVPGTVSIMAGAGNDTIIATSGITATDTINGGDGAADVLSLTMANANTLAGSTPATYNITNIEQLTLVTEFDGNQAVTNIATGINTVNLSLTGAVLMTGGNDTIQGGAGALTVNLGGSAAGNTTGQLGATMVVRAGGAAATDSVTINNTAINSTAPAVNIDVGNGKDITATNYENVTLNSGTIQTAALVDTFGTLTINADASASPTSLTMNGANSQTITSVVTNSTGLLSISGSGMTAQNAGTTTMRINGTTSGTGGTQSVTGSGGDDNITVGNFASTIAGGAGQDTIQGGTAADNIDGGAGNDSINTGNGNNIVTGGLGDDTITAGTGNDNIDGGTGNDSIILGANLTTNDTINGGEGNDTLSVTASTTLSSAAFANVTNIEQVALTGTAAVSLTAPLSSSTTSFDLSEAGVNSLTLATGYTGATTVLETNGTASNAGALDVITNSANVALTVRGKVADLSTVSITGGTGTDALVLTADNGAASLANTSGIETITMVAGSIGSSTATISSAVVATKVVLTVDASAMTDAGATFTFSGAASQAGGVNLTGATNAQNIVTLTNFAGASTVTGGGGADSITSGSGNDSLSGGAGADLYFFGANLNASDTVVDSSGTDILNATISGLTATTGALNISGVETLNFNTPTTASTANASTVSATSITGVTRINVANANNVTLTNLAAGTVLGLGTTATGSTAASNGYTGTLTFSLATATGASDAVTVNLANTNADSGSGWINATLVAAAGIETVTLAAGTTNASTLNVNGVATPSLVVNGGLSGKAITLTGGTTVLNSATTSFNSSASLGTVVVGGSDTGTTFTVNGANGGNNVTGGAGSDTITISNVGTAVQTVAGGAGTDTLNMTLTATTASAASISAVENVNLTLTNNTITDINTDGMQQAALTNVTVTGGTAASGITLRNTGTAANVLGAGAAFKSFDATGVSGAVDVTIAPAGLALGDSYRAGTGTSDVLRVAVSNTTGTAATISGFESMVISGVTTASSMAFTNATGINNIYVTGSVGATLSGLASGASIGVGMNAGSAGGVVATGGAAVGYTPTATLKADLTLISGTADTIGFVLANLDSTGTTTTTTLQVDGVETINISESTATAMSSTANLSITDANANAITVNLTGGRAGTWSATTVGVQDVTFVSGALTTNAAVGTLNATGFSGNMQMANGSRGATPMSITGGSGSDRIIMRAGADTLAGGSGTDNLVITFNANMGGFNVDLSSTTDQVGTWNGSANAVAQTAFENVDMSNVTGTYGADITARAAGSTIIGTRNFDNITGGAGADRITIGVSGVALTAGTGANIDQIDAGAGSDTLLLVGILTATAGQSIIDLSSTGAADNITKVANTAESVVQVGFENVDLSGLTMTTGGWSITAVTQTTATSTGSTIIGTNLDDLVVGSGGVDSITMGVSGATLVYDTIDGGAGVDTLTLVGNVTTSATIGQNIIDLGVTAGNDQLTKVNNVAETVVQKNFENLDLSGLTIGTGVGFTIAAISTGSRIVGSPSDDSITGGAGNDNISGGTGADTLAGGTGTDTINGGAGADGMTGGTGDTVDTYVLSTDTSVVASAVNFALGVSTTLIDNLDTMTFANGVDVITDMGFTGTGNLGVDTLDVTTAGTTYIDLSARTAATALAAGSHYYLQGTYTGGVFTANSAAVTGTANVALLIVADAIADTLANQTSIVILTGTSAVAANFSSAIFV